VGPATGQDIPAGSSPPTNVCGNGICGSNENAVSCSVDCSSIILNGASSGNSGAVGMMFKLSTNRAIVVKSFAFYTWTAMNSAIQVYHKERDWGGSEFNIAHWTKVFDKNVTYSGQNTLTTINLPGVPIDKDTSRSFYIVTNPSPGKTTDGNRIMYLDSTGTASPNTPMTTAGALTLYHGETEAAICA
jgi:hypothetical protein